MPLVSHTEELSIYLLQPTPKSALFTSHIFFLNEGIYCTVYFQTPDHTLPSLNLFQHYTSLSEGMTQCSG